LIDHKILSAAMVENLLASEPLRAFLDGVKPETLRAHLFRGGDSTMVVDDKYYLTIPYLFLRGASPDGKREYEIGITQESQIISFFKNLPGR
jgi:hypothetical protein